MDSTVQPNASTCYPSRFTWPMRFFLCAFIGDMLLRSMLMLLPYRQWSKELNVGLFPESLPTPTELNERTLASSNPPNAAKWDRLCDSLASVGPYFSPMPSVDTWRELDSAQNVGKYAAVWAASRLNFIGILFGVDQAWPMFSPTVAEDETLGRPRLVFADGSTQTWYSWADPPDPTSYCHWFEEKHLETATKLVDDEDAQRGYCNWLTHCVPTNEYGSPLVRIEIFKIYYSYPRPRDDAFSAMAAQTIVSFGAEDKPVWIYDVATRTGRSTSAE